MLLRMSPLQYPHQALFYNLMENETLVTHGKGERTK
jgi:hypothetical protein